MAGRRTTDPGATTRGSRCGGRAAQHGTVHSPHRGVDAFASETVAAPNSTFYGRLHHVHGVVGLPNLYFDRSV